MIRKMEKDDYFELTPYLKIYSYSENNKNFQNIEMYSGHIKKPIDINYLT